MDVDPSVMHRPLERLDITRKKKVPRASEQDSERVQTQRTQWREDTADIDPERLVFIDEMGINTKMARRSVWATGGGLGAAQSLEIVDRARRRAAER